MTNRQMDHLTTRCKSIIRNHSVQMITPHGQYHALGPYKFIGLDHMVACIMLQLSRKYAFICILSYVWFIVSTGPTYITCHKTHHNRMSGSAITNTYRRTGVA